MQQAQVIGNATSTRKHPSLAKQRLLVCQPLGVDGRADGDVILSLDQHGAGIGDRVILSSDGRGLRELLGKDHSPARWWTLGIIDEGQPFGTQKGGTQGGTD